MKIKKENEFPCYFVRFAYDYADRHCAGHNFVQTVIQIEDNDDFHYARKFFEKEEITSFELISKEELKEAFQEDVKASEGREFYFKDTTQAFMLSIRLYEKYVEGEYYLNEYDFIEM